MTEQKSPPPLTKEVWDARREALTRETRLHTARLNASEGAIILMDQVAPMVEVLFKRVAELEAERAAAAEVDSAEAVQEDVSHPIEQELGD